MLTSLVYLHNITIFLRKVPIIKTYIFDLFAGQKIAHSILICPVGEVCIQMPSVYTIFGIGILAYSVHLQVVYPFDCCTPDPVRIFRTVRLNEIIRLLDITGA